MAFLDLPALAATPLTRDPFPFLIVPGFIRPETLPELHADFPEIAHPGSFPASMLTYGPRFAELLAELQGPALQAVCAEKFDVDLTDRPSMVTVRGRARARDGQVHCDSKTKIITVLLYLNGQWEAPGGRLRLLAGPDQLENPVAEVPPDEGTLVAFLVTPHSWHGHHPFIGPRRVLQLNWVTDESVVRHEQSRHRLTARLKRWLPFFG